MQYRPLGKTGLLVSEIGHGTWGLGDWLDTSVDDAIDALRLSLASGVTFFDAAHSYGAGLSEELLGCLAYENPDAQLTLATKIPPTNCKLPSSSDDTFSSVYPLAHVLACAEESRQRLGVQTIDLLQFHAWHDDWCDDLLFERVVKTLKDEGFARSVGISLNAQEPWNGVRAVRSGLIDTVQVVYNLFNQAARWQLFPDCHDCGVGVVVRVPLDEGGLSGTFEAETSFLEGDWRNTYFSEPYRSQILAHLPELIEEVRGYELADAALRFCLSSSSVSCVVVGMRRKEHVAKNVAASDRPPLPRGVLKRLHRYHLTPSKP